MPRYFDCSGVILVSLTPIFARCSEATFSSRCLGRVYTCFLYSLGLVKSSIWASVWLVNEADITKDGWPVALPRLTSRPSDRRMIFLPSGNSISSTCGLTLLHL